MKRLIDLFTSIILLGILVVPLVFVTLLVRSKLGHPALFKQRRAGRDGRIFVMYKFRSMTDEKNPDGSLKSDNERLTPFGRFLRSTSIDELPGLINVIKGDMSLVGPRPLLVEYLPLYSKEQAKRHLVRPGITGWAQVNGRNAVSWEQRFAMDVWYAENHSLRLDFKILLLTIKKVFIREGIVTKGGDTMPPFKGS